MFRSLVIATTALLCACSTAALAQEGPGVAVGEINQQWNRVTIDYGVGDPATTELHVITRDGRTVVVDRNSLLDGTLVWDRKIDHHHVAPGRYRLEVVATGPNGTSKAIVRLKLGLIYVGSVHSRKGNTVLRYALAEAARVRLFVRRVGTRKFVLAERRIGFRGRNHITWDFRVNGRRVAAGRYVMLLRAVSLPTG
jgi:hypothetical protein